MAARRVAGAGGPVASGAVQPTLDDLGIALIDTTFVVLDLETTGLRAAQDRITEIGAVKVRGGEVLGELRTFVHPGCPIPAGITAVTGITDAMVSEAPTIEVVLPTLRGFLGSAVLVAHNAPFDVGFLRAAFAVHGHGRFEPVVVDTARLARRLIRDEVRNVRLATLAQHFRSRHVPEHRALADARATVDVLHGLIERAGSLGATTLEDLRELSRSTSDKRFRRISLVKDAPATCGVYRFLDEREQVLYVGKATDLRARLRTYFSSDRRRRTDDLVRETARVTWTATPTLIEAEVHEVREIHRQQPRYNRRSKRIPTPAYIAITREPFPRLSIVSEPRPSHLAVLGPLASRRVAEQLVEALQAAVPIRTCSDRLRVAQDHSACILKELGRCAAPCDGTQSRQAYSQVVTDLQAAFDDPSPVLAVLRKRMLEHAGAGRFERATEYRTSLHALGRALTSLRSASAFSSAPELVLRRTLDQGCEVVVVRHGRLAGSLLLSATDIGDRGADGTFLDQLIVDRLALTPLEEHRSQPSTDHREEIALILAWAGSRPTRLVSVDGHFAEPVAGGRLLHQADHESRRVARAVRRDAQALSREKVARRVLDPGAQVG